MGHTRGTLAPFVKNSQVVGLESGNVIFAVTGLAGKRVFGAGFLANLICDSLAQNRLWREIRCDHESGAGWGEQDLFRSRLDQIIDTKHPLVRLGRTVDWGFLERRFGEVYDDDPGQPPLPTCLMAGLSILTHTYDLSDEVLVVVGNLAPMPGVFPDFHRR